MLVSGLVIWMMNDEQLRIYEGNKVKLLTKSNNVIIGYLEIKDADYVRIKMDKDSKVGNYIHKCNIEAITFYNLRDVI